MGFLDRDGLLIASQTKNTNIPTRAASWKIDLRDRWPVFRCWFISEFFFSSYILVHQQSLHGLGTMEAASRKP